MTSAFYKKAQGIVLVFDVKKKDSFKSLSSWIVDLREVSTYININNNQHIYYKKY
jgi:GTPase SAR1 family protein